MFKNICVVTAVLNLSLMAFQVDACMDHYSYQRGYSASFFSDSRPASTMSNLALKKKVFKVKHPPATVVVIDEDSSLKIDYDLPPESKNVSLQFVATRNVELIDQDIFLTEKNGTATARFRVRQKGSDTITVTVSGEHEGEVVSYSSKIYINAKPATTS